MAKRASASRATKTKSKKPAAAEVEVVEEKAGEGIDTGIAVATTLLLVAAFLYLDYALGTRYSEGLFFKP